MHQYFKKLYIDGLFKFNGFISRLIGNANNANVIFKNIDEYEIVFQDKKGKITKYTSDSVWIQGLNKGNSTNKDDDDDYDDIQMIYKE